MAFHDMGYVNFDEPFKRLVHQGTILGPDGEKMSKSKGNVISPDDFVSKYGSDVFRMYLGFGFDYVTGGPWSDDGIKSIAKYLDRVERLCEKVCALSGGKDMGEAEKKLNFVLHNTIKSVSADIEAFSFNTAIARFMELTNAMYKYIDAGNVNASFAKETCKTLLKLMAPFAPHFTEELWEKMGGSYSIFNESYPVFDESALVRDEIEYPLQVNGRLKLKFTVPADTSKEDIEKIVRTQYAEAFEGKQIVKIIVVPGRIVNCVVK